MSIFNSLRLTPTKTASTGLPQVQTVMSLITNVRRTTARATSIFSKNQRPAEIPLLRITGITRDKQNLKRFNTPSLTSLANNVATKSNFVIPPFSTRYNTIRPAYKSISKPSRVFRARSSDDVAIDTHRFDAYETLTGVSHERPEVVLFTEFKPIFTHEKGRFQQYSYYNHIVDSGIKPNMTDVGHYIDAQINARNLRCANIVQMFQRMREKNMHFYNVYVNRRAEMTKSLNNLNTTIWFLLNVVRQMDTLKGQLDLRDDIHKVVPQNVIRNMSLNFTQTRASWLYNFLQRLSSQYLPVEYDITDVLERLGYEKTNTKNVFTSTKLWLQMLEEYKNILLGHSLEFLDINPISQRRDNNATVLNKTDVKQFNLKNEDPKGLAFLNEIVGYSPANITTATNATSRAFSSIYNRSAKFKSEEARIAALTNVVSKEFRFSRGLSITSVRRTLRDFYKFDVNDGTGTHSSGHTTSFSRAGNMNVFDRVVGQFTNNVADIPYTSNNSLASLAQQKPTEDIAVLPFESKYIEGDTGTITPGSAYYVDDILNLQELRFNKITPGTSKTVEQVNGLAFNTLRLEGLSKSLSTAALNFAVLVDGMNVYGVTEFDSQDRNPRSVASVMGNQSQFIESLISTFVDNKGRTLPYVRRDRLTSIFALARQNKLLKSQLFLYYMNRIARSYAADDQRSLIAPVVGDNTPFTDVLVKRMLTTILRLTRPSRLSLSAHQRNVRLETHGDSNDLTSNVIEASLRKGTKLSLQVESLLRQILEQFNNDGAISPVNDRTKFGGHMDTTIMMVVFDMIISIIARYGNQVITGRGVSGFRSSIRGGRITTYFVTQRDANYRSAVNDLSNRLKKEQALTQQITWCVLNSLGRMSDAIVGVVNNLNSTQSIARLRAISDVIDNKEELRQLMSEQQILMLGSNVFDITGKFFSSQQTNQVFGSSTDNNNISINSDDTVSIIDDSAITTSLRDAFFAFFEQPTVSGEKAINKKIVTVGLPLGFSQRLHQKVKVSEQKRTSYVEKQNDIIELVLYKIDLLNQDIVFKPQKFLFELSRFPVRNDSYVLAMGDNPTFKTIMQSVPTRDFEESFEEGSNSIAYFNDEVGTNDGSVALDAESYDFLDEDQKEEIIQNHITSYMCELYLKFLTGINTAEHVFDIDFGDAKDIRPVEQEFVRLVTTHKMSEIANFVSFSQPKPLSSAVPGTKRSSSTSNDGTKVVLFNTALTKALKSTVGNADTKHVQVQQPRLSSFSGIASRVSTTQSYQSARVSAPKRKSALELQRSTLSLSNSMSSISHRRMNSAVQALKNIASFTRMRTSISDGLRVQKDILRPKQFDRIFNVLFDPDDFEIDYDKTIETEFGKQTLQQMIKRGDILPGSVDKIGRQLQKKQRMSSSRIKNKSRTTSSRADLTLLDVNNFVIRERDRSEGDVSLEKYFVVINTFGEEEV